MRPTERIDRIASKLVALWKHVPDWRLGQLIVNLSSLDKGYSSEQAIFYTEDDRWEEMLDKRLGSALEKNET